MKQLVLGGCMAVSFALAGCASSPLQTWVNTAKWDGGVGNPGVSSQKTGEACAESILGVVGRGDASIETAKKNGGITKVSTVDHRVNNIFFFYGEYCTIVHGE